MSRKFTLTDAQRATGIERVGENIALRSGAGCGKTFVLARRFTELLMRCADQDDPLRRFVALTFTDKAALEMSQRVGAMLTELSREGDEIDRNRIRQWLQRLPEGRISTIHGFCASVLRRFAVEAAIDPDFAVCSDTLLSQQMIAEASEEALLRAVETGREDVAQLLTSVRYTSLVQQIQQLLNMRTNVAFEEYLDWGSTLERWVQLAQKQRAKAIEQLTGENLKRELDTLEALPCSDPQDKLAQYRDEKFAVIRRIMEDPDPELFVKLKEKPRTKGRNASWDGNVKSIRPRIRSLVSTVHGFSIYFERTGELDENAAKSLGTLVKLAGEADTLYSAAKRRRGLLDFDDLLIETHRLLSENIEVRKRLRAQIDQLLVDEAQDTNALQVALLEQLILGEERQAELTDGKLFVVGDAKQSIYRFRDAQVEVFDDLRRRIGSDKQETLDLSFRTHTAGVEFINHLFALLMGEQYEPIRADRKETPEDHSVEILLGYSADEKPISSAVQATKAQAIAVVQRIGEMLENKERLVWDDDANTWRAVTPGDIAILFARRTFSLAYERELALRRIPYYVVAGTGFYKQQEIFDVLNALRVIDNPFDDIALMGVLRSSLFALDDNTLMHIAEALDPPYLPALSRGDLLDTPGKDEHETLRFAIDLLGKLNRKKDALGIDQVIRELLDATGYEAVLLSQFEGKRMLGNVRLLLRHAGEAVSEYATLADFIARMDERLVNQQRYEQAPVLGETENVVRLMTIHKAKGLEFPVVFIPDLNAGRRGHTKSLLNRLDWGLTCKLKRSRSESEVGEDESGNDDLPLSYRLARLLEDRDQRKEDIRKLYVAVTRHKDHLVFVGADWRTGDGRFLKGDNYLRMMDEVLGITEVIDNQGDVIPYAAGQYAVSVRKVLPADATRSGRTISRGGDLLRSSESEYDFAKRIEKLITDDTPPALVGPLDPGIGKSVLSVTALSEFAHCPMLYYWKYEQRVSPIIPGDRTGTPAPVAAPGGITVLDPGTLGTLYHRCMELLNFDNPQDARSLVRQASAEIDLDHVQLETIIRELEQMLTVFRSHRLYQQLTRAGRTWGELEFLMDLDRVNLRGRIDLLYQATDGSWGIVDYKSDRISRENIEPRASRYELQMHLYAHAATRHLKLRDEKPIYAKLYFLRPGVIHTVQVAPGRLNSTVSRVRRIAYDLVSARRSGRFPLRSDEGCSTCSCRDLCRRIGQPDRSN